MKERIIKFLESENLSSAKFADDIGVQRSTVSHILSGRNNPSFDFIQKILLKYKYLNAEWLIMGTGNMAKSVRQGDLFENIPLETNISKELPGQNKISESKEADFELKDRKPLPDIQLEHSEKVEMSDKTVQKIITIYSDNTFDLYLPSK